MSHVWLRHPMHMHGSCHAYVATLGKRNTKHCVYTQAFAHLHTYMCILYICTFRHMHRYIFIHVYMCGHTYLCTYFLKKICTHILEVTKWSFGAKKKGKKKTSLIGGSLRMGDPCNNFFWYSQFFCQLVFWVEPQTMEKARHARTHPVIWLSRTHWVI